MYGITISILGVKSAIYKFSAERFHSTHPCKFSSGKQEASSCWFQINLYVFLLVDFLEKQKRKKKIKNQNRSGFVYLRDYSITQRCGWICQDIRLIITKPSRLLISAPVSIANTYFLPWISTDLSTWLMNTKCHERFGREEELLMKTLALVSLSDPTTPCLLLT